MELCGTYTWINKAILSTTIFFIISIYTRHKCSTVTMYIKQEALLSCRQNIRLRHKITHNTQFD